MTTPTQSHAGLNAAAKDFIFENSLVMDLRSATPTRKLTHAFARYCQKRFDARHIQFRADPRVAQALWATIRANPAFKDLPTAVSTFTDGPIVHVATEAQAEKNRRKVQLATLHDLPEQDLVSAIRTILRAYPSICANGMSSGESFGGPSDAYPTYKGHPDELRDALSGIRACLQFLELHADPSNGKPVGSYGMKHMVEYFHERTGLGQSYVTNGEGIIAALLLGFKVRPDTDRRPSNPNLNFGMKYSPGWDGVWNLRQSCADY
ncbi:hypothetical protein BBJ41_00845 [Burkholderia stabilis]|uniref:hypothetical protein n=1 Tax=Burkholderia cepacia complex TaxID=87882 RepID=UPI0008519180|nr:MULTISPECIES: hypothetical protein [Burkholderia cepacia complex]AOR66213.1 hypothetical protein BBJ41_00845 [Burkholderia stabilis]MBR8042138.1 hypothetical protein [Burkholderia cenocepacia]HDR9491981.1 hypothetical protein [Burkholderia stabilis]HDR9523985.1 hypothetical protein [Burkholderia stabilis]HDR9530708.1 hypothetical protein [Burkholderia stabilis]